MPATASSQPCCSHPGVPGLGLPSPTERILAGHSPAERIPAKDIPIEGIPIVDHNPAKRIPVAVASRILVGGSPAARDNLAVVLGSLLDFRMGSF